MRHRVAVLALDGVVPFDLGIAHRVFGAAWGAGGEPLYTVETCTVGGRMVRTSADFTIRVDRDESLLSTADTVVVAKQEPTGKLLEQGVLPPRVAHALERIPQDARIVSICTGAFVLAAAGVLDGRRATTHWMQAERMQKLFPHVLVDPAVLFTDEGRVPRRDERPELHPAFPRAWASAHLRQPLALAAYPIARQPCVKTGDGNTWPAAWIVVRNICTCRTPELRVEVRSRSASSSFKRVRVVEAPAPKAA